MEKDYRKVCTIESGNPSVCEWSPDSRYIMTATTSPRLRVDNGVKLWHVGGSIMYNEDMVELYHVVWRPQAPEQVAGGDPLSPIPVPHSSATAYLGTVKTPSKPAGAYRPPGARGLATPLHFKREDEGGAAHVVSNGTQNVGPNGFGRQRRAVPGAETVEPPALAVRSVPGAEPAGDENSGRNRKKKRGKKQGGETKLESEPNGGASLAPPNEHGGRHGGEGRSPERRGQGGRGPRSQSRHNGNAHSRSNTQLASNQGGAPNGSSNNNAGAAAAADSSQDPNAKKIRSLQKKVRAIEDLEMRLAGGEKLEDTQLKKIHTKSSVLKELESLDGVA
ncbi:eukaryotic translation initiation factor eIF2A domain-containing protein [Sarocladium implicatum]|nr:eukaryotic translation initiation factor eIF2A domain-containing protein [Sarocladium implicatum]